MAEKRKRCSLTVAEKQNIIKYVNENSTKKKIEIARKFEIPTSTLATILKFKDKFSKECGLRANSRRLKSCEHVDLEECVLKWLKECQNKNVAIGSRMLKEKAQEFAVELGHVKFRASNGWLQNFRKRNETIFGKICGESASIDEEVCEQWKGKLEYLRNVKNILLNSPLSTIESDPFASIENTYNEVYIKNEFAESEIENAEENPLQHEDEAESDDVSSGSDNEYLESLIIDPPPKKRKMEVDSSTAPKRPQNSLNKINSNIEGDEFYYFGLSIAAQLKNMPLENALHLQAKIQSLLTNERREMLKNSTSDYNCTQNFNTELIQDNLSADNRERFNVSTENGPSTNNIHLDISNVQNEKTQMSTTELNSINGQTFRTLHTIVENQLKMQQQIQKVQASCDQSCVLVIKKMLRENLIMSKESLKTLKKLFGEVLSPVEEEMGSFLPLSSLSEIEEMENKIKIKENEEALKTYIVSKKGNQNIDFLFRNLITDEILDAYNWDGRSGKRSLKGLKLFNVVLNDIFCHMSRKDYETEVRKFIELSHNRAKQNRIKQMSKEND